MTRNRGRILFASVAVIMGLTACTQPRRGENVSIRMADQEASEGTTMELADMDRAAPAPRTLSAPSPVRPAYPTKAKANSFLSGASKAEPAQYEPQQQAAGPRAKRMVFYSGQAVMRSTEPEKVLDSAVAITEGAGGYLEQREGLFVALRVPVERFDSLFQRLMRLAEVVSYSQDAEDMGEAMQDLEMRLKVVSATLDRLEALVHKAKTESQKLRLLQELKRLREEKEVLESSRATLTQKARFASIQLRLRNHTPLGEGIERADLADFLWIGRLSPFDEDRFRQRSRSPFAVPAGMVETGRMRRCWRATSAQGSELWGSRLDVGPIGDSRFWSEAIRVRLRDGFKSVDTSSAGAFRLCRFQSYGPTPYFYWVGVRSRGDEIDLAEFYFPNADQQSQLLPAILAAVERKSK